MVHYSVYLIGRFSTRTMVGFMVHLTRHLNDLRFICFYLLIYNYYVRWACAFDRVYQVRVVGCVGYRLQAKPQTVQVWVPPFEARKLHRIDECKHTYVYLKNHRFPAEHAGNAPIFFAQLMACAPCPSVG